MAKDLHRGWCRNPLQLCRLGNPVQVLTSQAALVRGEGEWIYRECHQDAKATFKKGCELKCYKLLFALVELRWVVLSWSGRGQAALEAGQCCPESVSILVSFFARAILLQCFNASMLEVHCDILLPPWTLVEAAFCTGAKNLGRAWGASSRRKKMADVCIWLWHLWVVCMNLW